MLVSSAQQRSHPTEAAAAEAAEAAAARANAEAVVEAEVAVATAAALAAGAHCGWSDHMQPTRGASAEQSAEDFCDAAMRVLEREAVRQSSAAEAKAAAAAMVTGHRVSAKKLNEAADRDRMRAWADYCDARLRQVRQHPPASGEGVEPKQSSKVPSKEASWWFSPRREISAAEAESLLSRLLGRPSPCQRLASPSPPRARRPPRVTPPGSHQQMGHGRLSSLEITHPTLPPLSPEVHQSVHWTAPPPTVTHPSAAPPATAGSGVTAGPAGVVTAGPGVTAPQSIGVVATPSVSPSVSIGVSKESLSGEPLPSERVNPNPYPNPNPDTDTDTNPNLKTPITPMAKPKGGRPLTWPAARPCPDDAQEDPSTAPSRRTRPRPPSTPRRRAAAPLTRGLVRGLVAHPRPHRWIGSQLQRHVSPRYVPPPQTIEADGSGGYLRRYRRDTAEIQPIEADGSGGGAMSPRQSPYATKYSCASPPTRPAKGRPSTPNNNKGPPVSPRAAAGQRSPPRSS